MNHGLRHSIISATLFFFVLQRSTVSLCCDVELICSIVQYSTFVCQSYPFSSKWCPLALPKSASSGTVFRTTSHKRIKWKQKSKCSPCTLYIHIINITMPVDDGGVFTSYFRCWYIWNVLFKSMNNSFSGVGWWLIRIFKYIEWNSHDCYWVCSNEQRNSRTFA